jgi:hypothetical protein
MAYAVKFVESTLYILRERERRERLLSMLPACKSNGNPWRHATCKTTESPYFTCGLSLSLSLSLFLALSPLLCFSLAKGRIEGEEVKERYI